MSINKIKDNNAATKHQTWTKMAGLEHYFLLQLQNRLYIDALHVIGIYAAVLNTFDVAGILRLCLFSYLFLSSK